MYDRSDAGDRRPASLGWGRRSRPTPGDAPPARDAPGHAEDDVGDPESVARGICLRALTGAPKTRKQLAELLAKRGVPEDAAESVLDRLAEVGLVDDAAFARAWVSSRQSGRGLARRALSAELRAKGVDAGVASTALEDVDPQDEWDTARQLVARRLPSMQRLDRPTAERRLIGMLVRKGYGGGLAGYVVREALEGRADAPGDGSAGQGESSDVGLDAYLP